jgi:hypothetical protein
LAHLLLLVVLLVVHLQQLDLVSLVLVLGEWVLEMWLMQFLEIHTYTVLADLAEAQVLKVVLEQ